MHKDAKATETREKYEWLLRDMVEKRTGKEFDIFLTPQVKNAAACWQMIDCLHDELMSSDMIIEIESPTGNVKIGPNPLLAYYDKFQRTLIQHLTALGLNYASNPKRIKEDAGSGGDADRIDNMFATLQGQ